MEFHALTRALLAALAGILIVGTAAAESSPYAGLEGRAIKALSEEEIADLLAGRGAGMALPAELNHYPGPKHVLELAANLRLTPDQQAETRRLFGRMQAEAVSLGEAVVTREAELDQLFSSGAAEEGALRLLVADIARLRGELRFTHLKYHLAMRRLLSMEQVTAYDTARNYAGGQGAPSGVPKHGGGGHHQ
jgi:Spy/CpxP family protein refolding chaperone